MIGACCGRVRRVPGRPYSHTSLRRVRRIGTVRIKDHWAEQRLFERRALAAAIMITGSGWPYVLDRPSDRAAGHALRLLRGTVAGQSRARGTAAVATRTDFDRNGAVLAEKPAGVPARVGARARPGSVRRRSARTRRHQCAAGSTIVDETLRLVRSRRSFDSVPVRLRLTDDEIGRFAVHRFEFPGVDIATRQTRTYPHGGHAVHALGYVARSAKPTSSTSTSKNSSASTPARR